MKFRGKAISGTSLIVMLGVVLTATTIVAAAMLLGSTTWTNTVPETGVTVTKTTATTGLALPDAPIKDQAYTFGLNVVSHVDTVTGYLLINITKTGIASADVELIFDANNDGLFTDDALDGAPTGDVITYTVVPAVDAKFEWSSISDITYNFQITYKTAGTYVVQASAYAE